MENIFGIKKIRESPHLSLLQRQQNQAFKPNSQLCCFCTIANVIDFVTRCKILYSPALVMPGLRVLIVGTVKTGLISGILIAFQNTAYHNFSICRFACLNKSNKARFSNTVYLVVHFCGRVTYRMKSSVTWWGNISTISFMLQLGGTGPVFNLVTQPLKLVN